MDEYLTEREQIELIKQWWRENRWYLIGGAAIAGLAYLGYAEYRDYRNAQAEGAADLFVALQQSLEDDSGREDELLARLRAEHPGSPYTQEASMLMAKEVLISDTNRAADLLRDAMENSRDPGLALIARLRLARVLAYQQHYSDALALLAIDDAGEFGPRFNEVRGDIHAAAGEIDAARTAYVQALTAPDTSGVNRGLVQMKLAALQSGGAVAIAAPALDAADGEAAVSASPAGAATPAAAERVAPAADAPAADAPAAEASAVESPAASGETEARQ